MHRPPPAAPSNLGPELDLQVCRQGAIPGAEPDQQTALLVAVGQEHRCEELEARAVTRLGRRDGIGDEASFFLEQSEQLPNALRLGAACER